MSHYKESYHYASGQDESSCEMPATFVSWLIQCLLNRSTYKVAMATMMETMNEPNNMVFQSQTLIWLLPLLSIHPPKTISQS